jgi:hypothetical protein
MSGKQDDLSLARLGMAPTAERLSDLFGMLSTPDVVRRR